MCHLSTKVPVCYLSFIEEIEILDLENLSSVKKMTLSAPVTSFIRVGFQTK